MRHIEKEIDKLVYDEYGDILDKKDKQIEEQDKQIEEQENEITKLKNKNQEYKNKLKQLNELNQTPEAKKIINSMMKL